MEYAVTCETADGVSDGLLNKRGLALKLNISKRTVDAWMRQNRCVDETEASAVYQSGQDSALSVAGRARKTQCVSRQLMNAHDPPKETPLLGGKGPCKLTKAAAYHALDLLQTPFGFVFWLIEQRKARLQDQIDSGKSRR